MKKQGKLQIKIFKGLIEKYNIEADKIEKNDESTDGNVYIISTKDKKYVAKLYNNKIHTESMVGIHSLLIDNQISIPEIVCTEDKQKFAELDNNNYMVVYLFIEGEQISWSSKYCKLEKSIIKEIANILKKIHTVTYSV